jgi:FkbH-like protein
MSGSVENKLKKLNIVLSGTFTIEPVKESLLFWLNKFYNKEFSIEFTPYNQVFQQLLNINSTLSKNTGINIILLRLEDLMKRGDNSKNDSYVFNYGLIKKNVDELIESFKTYNNISDIPTIVCLCPASVILLADNDIANKINSMEEMVYNDLISLNNIYPVKSSEIFNLYNVPNYYDFNADKIGQIPYTPKFYSSIGTILARKLYSFTNLPFKAIILDCDNTLWRGICGEDGVENVKFSDEDLKFHKFLKNQKDAGMILGLCSKNNEEDVINVFKNRKESVLKMEDFVIHRINWDSKSDNLKSIADELNIGEDSIIFIDDNPGECFEVKTNASDILTLQLQDENNIMNGFINHVWAFEHLKVTEADKKRTKMYYDNSERKKFQKQIDSYKDFIDGLNLNIEYNSINNENLSRASQLTFRVNQFNFTTVRRTEKELIEFLKNDNTSSILVKLSDKFGEYGDIGLVIYKIEKDVLVVDNFLMSCRALGKGIEYKILKKISETALSKKLDFIKLDYIKSEKNKPAYNFINSVASSYGIKNGNESYAYKIPVSFIENLNPDDFNNENTATYVETENVNEKIGNETSEINTFISRNEFLESIVIDFNDIEKIFKSIISSKKVELNQGEYISPKTSTEKTVAEIWEDIFNVKQISCNVDFFVLGGDSMKAIQILSRLQETFQIEIPLNILFESSFTISHIAEVVENKQLESLDEDTLAAEIDALKDLSPEEIDLLLRNEI